VATEGARERRSACAAGPSVRWATRGVCRTQAGGSRRELVHPGPDGTSKPVAPVPADLAVDGIDELLKVFVAYSVARWGSYFTDILANSPGRTYTVRTVGAAWRVRTSPGLFAVEDDTVDDAADVTVSGPPTAVLRWVWNREGAGEQTSVTVEGDPEAVKELRRCIVTATQ
jgi:hypothetical protein